MLFGQLMVIVIEDVPFRILFEPKSEEAVTSVMLSDALPMYIFSIWVFSVPEFFIIIWVVVALKLTFSFLRATLVCFLESFMLATIHGSVKATATATRIMRIRVAMMGDIAFCALFVLGVCIKFPVAISLRTLYLVRVNCRFIFLAFLRVVNFQMLRFDWKKESLGCGCYGDGGGIFC